MAQNGDGVSGEDGRLGARFVKLWAASTTSALGSGLTVIAAPLYVASRTSNPLIVSGGCCSPCPAVSWSTGWTGGG
jgi:hypothetical protein